VTLGPPRQQIHDRMDAVELELASVDRARAMAGDARASSRRRSLGEGTNGSNAVSADGFLGKTAGAFRSQLGSGAQRSGSVQHGGSSAQQDSWFTSKRTVPSPPPSQQEPRPGGWGADLFRSPERIFSPIGFGAGAAAAGGGAASHALVAAPRAGPGMRGGESQQGESQQPLHSNISDGSNPGLLGSLNEAGRQGPPHALAA